MAEIDRYYAYQSLFTGRTAVPKSEILKKLEISSATFKRDLAMFRDRLNTPILYDRDLGGYKLENPEGLQQLPGMWFSQEEALALMTIQTMIGQLEPGLLGPKLKPLQTRLNKILETQGGANSRGSRWQTSHAFKVVRAGCQSHSRSQTNRNRSLKPPNWRIYQTHHFSAAAHPLSRQLVRRCVVSFAWWYSKFLHRCY
jgi:predicted DNA-binding transcriptional regulator YafY